ncbi:MAG: ATP-binding cassette domain-containing protein [Candidatus Methanoplasma sp.]|jgi:ABC-type lipoprotein export system ATPase subunit|nr:ATP-binding cassette domain-containing protein [Candidatus Methanoplasma sp.]
MIERNAKITITVHPGTSKGGELENFDPIDINPGDTISIVGPTGSGKTAFINDIEVFAQGDTVTGRRIDFNGEAPPDEFSRDPARKPVAMITQNTKCLADLTVREFLDMHASIRGSAGEGMAERALDLANGFTGEKIDARFKMSSLSGGQTRSLMIADAVAISDAPILLLDEIENAGIFRDAVIATLRSLERAVIFVTHDPYVSMISDRRIVMRDGRVESVLRPRDSEREALASVRGMDEALSRVRERIRAGEVITGGGAL